MSMIVSRNYAMSGGPNGFSSGSGMSFSGFSGNSLRLSRRESRAQSVHGGAGGYGTRLSSTMSSVSMAPSGGEVCVVNEKQTMQNLNDRLASYLEKVKTLEAANQKLELQIKEFLDQKCPLRVLDHTAYSATIEDIRKQIAASTAENVAINLQIDNAKLAADDFRVKFENENSMRLCVESEIAGLKGLKSEMERLSKDMDIQINGLNEELAWIKSSHEEDLQQLREQQSGSVHVEMDCAPPVDLEKVLQDMREQYEMVIEKNHRDAEKWFESKAAVLQTQVTTDATEVKTSQTEVTDLKKTVQSLELELQGLLTQKGHLEQQVSEVGGRYGMLLHQLQLQINSMEEELQQLGASIHQQSAEYQLLLDIKMRLEMEIAQYRKLLEGEDDGIGIAMGEGEGKSLAMGISMSETKSLGMGMGMGMGESKSLGMGMGMGMGMGETKSLGMGMSESKSLGMGMSESKTLGMGMGMGESKSLGMGISMSESKSLGMGMGMGMGEGEGESCITRGSDLRSSSSSMSSTMTTASTVASSVTTEVSSVTTEVSAILEELDEDARKALRQRRVKVIMEDLVDGVVVSSSVDEKIQEMD